MDWDGMQARAALFECVGIACTWIARFGLWLNVAATNVRLRAFTARLKAIEQEQNT